MKGINVYGKIMTCVTHDLKCAINDIVEVLECEN